MRIFQNRPSTVVRQDIFYPALAGLLKAWFPLPWQRAGCNHRDVGAYGQKAEKNHQPKVPKQRVAAPCPQAAGGVQRWQLMAQMPSLSHLWQPSIRSILLAVPRKYDRCLWQLSSRLWHLHSSWTESFRPSYSSAEWTDTRLLWAQLSPCILILQFWPRNKFWFC